MTDRVPPRTPPRNDLPVRDLRLRPDASGRVAVDPGRAGWRYLSFETVPVTERGVTVAVGPSQEVAIVVLAGRDIRIAADGAIAGVLEGRDDPFAGLPWAAWIPSARSLELRAAGAAVVAVARAPRSGRPGPAAAPRIVTPADVEVEIRGAGSATRQVNHILAPEFPADRLLMVEVLTPSGNWSSWPPHKHDVDHPPEEAILEEVYLYQFRRPEAWGVQRVYRRGGAAPGPPRDAVWPVRHGDLVLVTDGYHPFVASPGDDAYYLNALAGDRRTMACSFDPDLSQTWAPSGVALDPRVPMVNPSAALPVELRR